MSHYPYTHRHPSGEQPGDAVASWILAVLLILAIALIVIAAPRDVSAPPYGAQQQREEAAFLAQNPELRAYFVYNEGDGRLGIPFLAQNPEVGVYRRNKTAHR